MTFVGEGIGLNRAVATDGARPEVAGSRGYAFTTGIAILVLVPVHFLLALPLGEPLHPWWGLFNWSAVGL